jgi:taurine dioxygenase
MVVVWDNRWILHAAVHDDYPQRRMMERVTIKGDRPFGTGDLAPISELRRRKVPSIKEFKNRPKRQHEID